MAQWWNSLVTGLGQQNAPFGFAPGQDPYQAGMQMIGNVGAGMLANSSSNPMEALGRGYLGAQEMSRQNSKEAFAAKQMMEQAEERRLERQAQAEQQAMMEEEISKLPPEEQAYARMMPDKYFGAQIDQKFATRGTPEFGLNPIALKNLKTGEFVGYGQMSKAGGLFMNGKPIGSEYAPMDPMELAFGKSSANTQGKIVGDARGDLPGARNAASFVKEKIDNLINDPSLDSAVGWTSYVPNGLVPNKIINVRTKLAVLESDAFLQARDMLKGAGQITDFESKKAEAAYNAASIAIQSSDPAALREALVAFKDAIDAGIRKIEATAGQAPQDGGGAAPEGGWQTLPNGVKIRKKN